MDWRIDPALVVKAVKRVRVVFALIVILFAVFLIRLFYVQIINYNHYHSVAINGQLKKYEVPAKRGVILAHQGDDVVPIVLNQKVYTLYADPVYIKQPKEVAKSLAEVLGGHPSDYLEKLTANATRYSVIKKRVSESKQKRVLAYKYPGIGAKASNSRVYPNGSTAAQLLGFVNAAGGGEYGVEQAMNQLLNGKPGRVKAVTDIHGVPLAASTHNISVQPSPGDDVVLTIDMSMQKQLESTLENGKKAARARAASALILDVNTGDVKAMANYPSYNPAKYYEVSDSKLFQNATVSHSIEVGSIMKTLTAAAALNQGVITPNTSFYDPGHWTINGFNITDVEPSKGTQTISSFLNLSLNTGATWLLMQMGGGEINTRARNTWHNYMTDHFMLGKKTGIAQGYETAGLVPSPGRNGAGINLTYANTTFGQAMTATPIQMAAALASVVNGGTYYQPRLVDKVTSPKGRIVKNYKPEAAKQNVVKPSTGKGVESLMNYVVEHHYNLAPMFDQEQYTVGGKTGTAQIARPNGGGYYANRFNATYLGFVGGEKPEYVIVVFVFDPDTSQYAAGFAGALTAQPIFADLAKMLINNGYVAPGS